MSRGFCTVFCLLKEIGVIVVYPQSFLKQIEEEKQNPQIQQATSSNEEENKT